jgi:phosphatidylglycerophosphate synthase
MGPDHLTALGVVGALCVLGGYLLSWISPVFLWLAVYGFVLHWFGDSLDGSLARFRKTERPRYGYFLDHSVDALCNFFIMIGFGSTQFVRLDSSLLALTGYYMLCMYVFLYNQVSGVFQLSFFAFGPTELRICLIIMTVCMYFFGAVNWQFGAQIISIYDFVLLGASGIFIGIFMSYGWAKIVRLRKEEALGDPSESTDHFDELAQSPAIKLSI